MNHTKFKYWSKDHKTMTEPFTAFIADNLITLQETGLKDLHGTDVFEGDIIRYILAKECFGVVAFERGRFVIKDTNSSQALGYVLENWEGEAMGNIYEHPGLLDELKTEQEDYCKQFVLKSPMTGFSSERRASRPLSRYILPVH